MMRPDAARAFADRCGPVAKLPFDADFLTAIYWLIFLLRSVLYYFSIGKLEIGGAKVC
jgi:hypothetical protein